MATVSSASLLAEARRNGFRPDDDLRRRIDEAVAETTEPLEIGRLLVAKTIALQGCGDATLPAEAASAAAMYLKAGGVTAEAAFASAMAAVFSDQIGDFAAAMEHAVDAMVMLGDSEPDQHDAVRASLAICGFFSRISAFDLAIENGRRAFDGARQLTDIPVDSVAYSFGYVAAEAGHLADDQQRPVALGHATEAATWLAEHGTSDLSRDLLAPALFAEIDLAAGLRTPRGPLESATGLYEGAAPDLVAWHRLVRASADNQHGEHAEAVRLLDLAIPGLTASADNHCLARAMKQRAHALAEQGDFAGAYDESRRLAAMTRNWQVEQVGRLANQVARRADLERSSSVLRRTAEQLAHDVDVDATTGVNSRRWLDRRLVEMTDDDRPAWTLMFDLDGFKAVNDTFGHRIGDEVLERFGALLQSAADGCSIARFGGEEFVVIMPDDGLTGSGTDLAERIRLDTATHDWESIAPGLAVTVSCGVARGPMRHADELLVAADQALLDAKRRGRNRIALSPTAMVGIVAQ